MSGRMRVVFQGEPGANSHIAALDVFPCAEIIPCPTFEDCFAAIESGAADLGMIPIENSIFGRVTDIHHLLPNSGIHITGEYFLPIKYQLMGLPGTKLSDLVDVQSHVQALGQCRLKLRELGLKPIAGADTAGSAREIRDRGDRTRGALAPALAAQLYGLDIILGDLRDEAHNTTRFVVLSRTPSPPPPFGEPTCISFLFRVRNVPAALYKALGGFATNGVNMTKLESYQLEGQFAASQFFAEVEAHPDEPGVKLAFEELKFFSAEFRILGAYAQHPYRMNLREPG